jgi:hypothetical protein
VDGCDAQLLVQSAGAERKRESLGAFADVGENAEDRIERLRRDHDDPTNNLASRLSHRVANWRSSKRFAPSRRRGLHPTPSARAPRAGQSRFASDRSSKRSCSPRMAASRPDDNPKLPDTKPIAAPTRTFPRLRSGVNEVRSRSARNFAPRDLTEASRFPNWLGSDSCFWPAKGAGAHGQILIR